MEPDRFTLTNPEWDKFLKDIIGKVQIELGLEKQKLEAHLHDLLLYETLSCKKRFSTAFGRSSPTTSSLPSSCW